MKTILVAALSLLIVPSDVYAMCGCMVGLRPPRPPTKRTHVARRLLNEASKVVFARDGDQTVMTMSNDVISDYDEFGLIVPVPTVIKKGDVRIAKDSLFKFLEQQTNPRIVETWDPDPCPSPLGDLGFDGLATRGSGAGGPPRARSAERASDFGVKVDAHYSVGEYDIAILSAKKGGGDLLMKWLNRFHYEVPEKAVPVLNSYIKQDMKFFVAKVNFKKVKNKGERAFLRPIQVRYETPKFMLPVRLGTVNANGPQELVAYMLSPKGRVEATNYRTLTMPSGQDLPAYVKNDFENVYAAIFDHQTKKNEQRVIFTEFFHGTMPTRTAKLSGLMWAFGKKAWKQFKTTRLHFRYDATTFPEDLMLQETGDTTALSVRFNVKNRARNVNCEAGEKYLETLPPRREKEAENLAELTGWEENGIRKKMGLPKKLPPAPPPPPPVPESTPPPPPKSWWDRLFRD